MARDIICYPEETNTSYFFLLTVGAGVCILRLRISQHTVANQTSIEQTHSAHTANRLFSTCNAGKITKLLKHTIDYLTLFSALLEIILSSYPFIAMVIMALATSSTPIP